MELLVERDQMTSSLLDRLFYASFGIVFALGYQVLLYSHASSSDIFPNIIFSDLIPSNSLRTASLIDDIPRIAQVSTAGSNAKAYIWRI